MTATVLEILVAGKKEGTIVLKGPNKTELVSYKPKEKLNKRLARKNLLIIRMNYNCFTQEEYISRLQKGMSADLNQKVIIQEINLNNKTTKLLDKFYNHRQKSYSIK